MNLYKSNVTPFIHTYNTTGFCLSCLLFILVICSRLLYLIADLCLKSLLVYVTIAYVVLFKLHQSNRFLSFFLSLQSHSFFVQKKVVKEWTVYHCRNCDITTHAVSDQQTGDNRKFFIGKNMEVSLYALVLLVLWYKFTNLKWLKW